MQGAVKKKLAIFVCLIVLVVFTIAYQDEHDRNIKKVKLSMTTEEVIKIMGNPIKIDSRYSARGTFSYCYLNSHFLAADNYFVFFSVTDSLVVYINYGS